MKSIFIFPFIMVLSSLFSCRHQGYLSSLLIADSLCEANPDSAIAFLYGLSSHQSEFDDDSRLVLQVALS